MRRLSTRSAAYSLRLLLVVTVVATVASPLLHASAPGWWSNGVIDSTKQANDYAAVNQGQLKNIAAQALLAMDTAFTAANLPVSSTDAAHTSVAGWSQPNATRDDYQAVNLGQVKSVAQLFYDRFKAVYYTDRYPWTGLESLANDYAAANIGQVKNLFSFDFTQPGAGLDLDHNGLPDYWEMKYFGHTGVDPVADPDQDGLTNLQEFTLGSNPTASQWNLLKIAGDGQSGAANSILSSPLITRISNQGNLPVENVDVTFTVSVGSGLLSADRVTFSSTLTVASNATGQTQVYFRLGGNAGVTSEVTASAGETSVIFLLSTTPHPGPPEVASNLVAKQVSRTEIALSWDDNSDNEAGFRVERSQDEGQAWITVGTVDANVVNFSDRDIRPFTYLYRVTAFNADGDAGEGTGSVAAAAGVPSGGGGHPNLNPTVRIVSELGLCYEVVDLGGFVPYKLNNKAQIAGGSGVWQNGQVFSLAQSDAAADINDNGLVVGMLKVDDVYLHGASWSSLGANPTDLGAIDERPCLVPVSAATSCGNDGSVYGTNYGNGPFQCAVKFQGAGGTPGDIMPPPGTHCPSTPPGILHYGAVVGCSRAGGLWTGEITLIRPELPTLEKHANRGGELLNADTSGIAINGDGFVVGQNAYSSGALNEPIIFEPGSQAPTSLPLVGLTTTTGVGFASGINDAVGKKDAQSSSEPNPEAVGAMYTASDGTGKACYWRKDLKSGAYYGVDLNKTIPQASGWHLTDAYDINDAGFIIGWGTYTDPENPDAVPQPRGYLLVPKPLAPDDPGQTDIKGAVVPSFKGLFGEKHFVSPKKAGDTVVIRADLPNPALFDQLYEWVQPVEGVTFAGNKSSISRDSAKRYRAQIAYKGTHQIVDTMNVWIVWAQGTMERRVYPTFVEGVHGYSNDGSTLPGATYVTARDMEDYSDYYKFRFDINPKEITMLSQDIPNLTCMMNGFMMPAAVPGGSGVELLSQSPLYLGAQMKWDVSRRKRVEVKNPGGIDRKKLPKDSGGLYAGQPSADKLLEDFPSNGLIGNDDGNYNDEQNDPYSLVTGNEKALDHGVGSVTSHDAPQFVVLDDLKRSVGDVFEVDARFAEFLRLQINNTWYRVSDDLNWYFIMKAKYQAISGRDIGKWTNNYSDSGPTQ